MILLERRHQMIALTLAAVVGTSCRSSSAALTQRVEARRLASDLHVEFAKAAEASNRAVMADTDDASAAAADEARRARQSIERDVEALAKTLESVGFIDDKRSLDAFTERFAEYRRLDDEILPLAVENTNLKAQRLSFGPAQEAAEAFRAALAGAARGATGSCCGDAIANRARAALLEIQVLQAPHIAESDDAAMTRIESRMKELARTARAAIDELEAPAATAALDRFMGINDEIVALSRRNSNVRSLALSLGRKRMVTAECEDDLRALEDALAKHEYTATR
jgi:hypothetical protein